MLFIYCEGNEKDHTEALFVSQILNPYLRGRGKPPAVPVPSHGLAPFSRALSDLRDLLRNPHARVTTLIDYYGMPADYPGMPHRSLPPGNRAAAYAEVARLEGEFAACVGSPRFIPYYAVHEFEALAFASPTAIDQQRRLAGGGSVLSRAEQMLADAQGNPELVNDAPTTSPSHRLADLWPKDRYQKTVDSIGIVRRIPFTQLLATCRHFDSWVTRLLALPH